MNIIKSLPSQKNHIIIALTIMLTLLLSGCSSEKIAVTSSDNPELRCKRIKSFSNDKNFWDFAYENIPTVSYDELSSGAYDSSYVCLDGIMLAHDIEFLIAFQKSDSSYTDDTFLPDLDDEENRPYGYKILEDISSGTSIKLCVYIQNGEPYFMKGIKKINKSFDLDTKDYLKKRNERISAEIEESRLKAELEKGAQKSDNPLMNQNILSDFVTSGDKSKILT